MGGVRKEVVYAEDDEEWRRVPKRRRELWRYGVLGMGLLMMAVAGTIYCFNAYSQALKIRLNITDQTEANLIISVGTLGNSLGVIAGGIFDYAGPRWTSGFGVVWVVLGYVMMYLCVCNKFPSIQNYIFASAALAVVGQGSNHTYTTALQTQVVNFPKKHRGKAVGMVDALFGASAAIMNSIYAGTFGKADSPADQNLPGYFLFLAGLIGAVNVIAIFVLRFVPYERCEDEEEEDEARKPLTHPNLFSAGSPAEPVLRILNDDLAVVNEPVDISGFELLRTPFFYTTALSYTLLSSMGLVFQSNIGYLLGAMSQPTTVVKIMTIITPTASCLARLVFGFVSDWTEHRISRTFWASVAGLLMLISFLLVTFQMDSVVCLGLGCFLLGSGFGGVNSVIPTLVSEVFGIPNFGKNWGIIIFISAATAFGFQFVVGDVYQEHDTPGSPNCYGSSCYFTSFAIASLLCILGFCISILNLYLLKKKHQRV